MKIVCLTVLGFSIALATTDSLAYTCQPGTNQVAIYRHGDFGAPCKILGLGNYVNFDATGFANDSISSIIVGPNTRAILYQDAGYRGDRNTFEAGSTTAYFNDMGPNANDSATAIRVIASDGRVTATKYLGSHPSEREASWTKEAQGLAHDQYYWYMTRNDSPTLMKWNLSANFNSGNPFLKVGMPVVLQNYGCDHYGDPDVYQHPKHGGLLIVPLEGCRDPYTGNAEVPIVALFRTSDLSLFAFDTLYAQGPKAGWVAVNPKSPSSLFSSGKEIGYDEPMIVYQVDWDNLEPSHQPQWFMTQNRETRLYDYFDGEGYLPISYPQGAAFSTDGNFFYLVNGYNCSRGGFLRVFASSGFDPNDNNVFYMHAMSANGYGRFNYENHCSALSGGEEPQGIDYLDMTGKGAPYGGQLHVMLLDNDVASNDNLYIKHYSTSP